MEPMWGLEEPVETQNEEPKQAVQDETSAFAVSVDDFAALEERVRRAVDVVKREREARTAIEARAAELEARAAHAEKRHAELEARAENAEARQAELAARASNAEKQQAELEERAAKAEERQSDLEARATLAEAQLKSQSPVMEQLKLDVGALNAEREQVKQRVERLLSQLDALEL